MNKEEYKVMYEIEKDYWWYRGMRYISMNLIKKYLKNKTNIKILDAGCGTGINMQFLGKFGKVYGIDFSEDALNFCRMRNLKNIKKMSIENIDFKDNTFDLVTSFDVIYHQGVKDDMRALSEINKVLKKGGILLIRVPAFNFLYSEHDKAVHTARRYTKKELTEKLGKAGFIIKKLTYANFFMFFPVTIIRLLKQIFPEKSQPKSDLKQLNPLLNKVLSLILKFESFIIDMFNLPFGISLIAVAVKK